MLNNIAVKSMKWAYIQLALSIGLVGINCMYCVYRFGFFGRKIESKQILFQFVLLC
jgi:hypothetical protein